jgi:hypothetical protein
MYCLDRDKKTNLARQIKSYGVSIKPSGSDDKSDLHEFDTDASRAFLSQILHQEGHASRLIAGAVHVHLIEPIPKNDSNK